MFSVFLTIFQVYRDLLCHISNSEVFSTHAHLHTHTLIRTYILYIYIYIYIYILEEFLAEKLGRVYMFI